MRPIVGQDYTEYDFDDTTPMLCHTPECVVEMMISLLLWAWHMYQYGDFMYMWAEGSFILITGSLWFHFITVWNMAIVMKYPGFMEMDSLYRFLPFAMALMFNLYYYAGVIAWFVKLWTMDTRQDSVEEIIFGFIIWLSTPTAFVSTAYNINLWYYGGLEDYMDTSSSIDM